MPAFSTQPYRLPSDTDNPELGSVSIAISSPQYAQYAATEAGAQLKARSQVTVDTFLSYEYYESYLKPCDTWSFTFSQDSMSQDDLASILPGCRVDVSILGQPQTSGFLDKLKTRASAGGGTIVSVEGRSWNSSAVDGHVDPSVRFTSSMSLLDLANAVLEPFGMTAAATDNVANRNAMTGGIYGTKTSKTGKPLKSYILHQEKPYPQEGAWAFLCRVAQRFGLWPRAAADGQTVIFAVPDFSQSPTYRIQHKTDDTSQANNVLESDVSRDREQQPSLIFASGYGGGGEFPKSTLRGVIINPLVYAANVDGYLARYPSLQPIDIVNGPAVSSALQDGVIVDPNARPLFMYDPEAHTQDQLNAFLRRELSLRMRKSLEANYTILGHRIGGLPLAVDTIADVDDDRSNVHIPLWILSRRFSKRAGTGTLTQLELIRPGTLAF